MRMKKFFVLSVIFMLAFGVSCKKKEVAVEAPPPPPPVEKISQQEFMKSLISMVTQLNPGEVKTVNVDKEKVISEESSFNVSLFPLEFFNFKEENYIVKYLFPSVVWKWDDFQLEILNLEEYYLHRKAAKKVGILKESPKGTSPFDNIPTLLLEASNGKFWVLNQKGYEMPLRNNSGK